MTGTLLSYHGPATHRDASDDEILRAWQPKSAKLFNADWGSTDRLAWLYANLPATTFLYRNWPQSEEFDDMFNNPVATGRRHADEWATRVHNGRDGSSAWRNLPGFRVENQVMCGINEPTLNGPRFEAGIAQVAAYYVAFLDTLRAHGLRGGALSLGVGWPNNAGTNTRVRWEPFESVRQAIVRGNHYLILHEYWDIAGPQQNLGWWFGRFKQCPWDVPIIFGELGVDRGVQGPTWQGTRGYSGHMSAEAYIQQLHWADQYMRADRRVHSATVFTWDYADNQWHSFALREIREQFLNHVISQRDTPNPAPTAFPLYPPNVTDPLPPTGGGTMTLTERFIQLARAEFGDAFEDLRATLPQHATLRFDPIDSRTMRFNCFHHTATAINTTWLRVAQDHITADPTRNKPAYAGIGYHMGVRLGKLALLGNLDTMRAHVKGRNDEALGIAWMGNSDMRDVPLTDIDILRRLVTKVLDPLYEPNKENTWHGAMLPGYTACPGSAMRQIVPTLRIPPAPPEPQWSKVVWAMEEAARILLREGLQHEHDTVLSDVSYVDAVRERDN
jgi:hypothetical protein